MFVPNLCFISNRGWFDRCILLLHFLNWCSSGRRSLLQFLFFGNKTLNFHRPWFDRTNHQQNSLTACWSTSSLYEIHSLKAEFLDILSNVFVCGTSEELLVQESFLISDGWNQTVDENQTSMLTMAQCKINTISDIHNEPKDLSKIDFC